MYEWDTWDIVFYTDSLTTATFKQLFPKDVVPKKHDELFFHCCKRYFPNKYITEINFPRFSVIQQIS